MRVKLTSRNRLTIPGTVLAGFPGCRNFDVTQQNGRIVLTPVRLTRADDVRAKLAELGINSLWWNPGERRERRGARLTRRVREEYRVYFDRNATQSAARAAWFSRDASPLERRLGFTTGC